MARLVSINDYFHRMVSVLTLASLLLVTPAFVIAQPFFDNEEIKRAALAADFDVDKATTQAVTYHKSFREGLAEVKDHCRNDNPPSIVVRSFELLENKKFDSAWSMLDEQDDRAAMSNVIVFCSNPPPCGWNWDGIYLKHCWQNIKNSFDSLVWGTEQWDSLRLNLELNYNSMRKSSEALILHCEAMKDCSLPISLPGL